MNLYYLGLLFLSKFCNGVNQYTYSPQDAKGPIVYTSTGALSGKYDQVLGFGMKTFYGIPYALPPLGEKRFAKPQPIGVWNGILLAENKSDACMQYSERDLDFIPKGLNVSEDCLYLNVWTPATQPTDELAVMVWIHGGGNCVGSASMDLYDGGILAALGSVVVVSMNYRLGLFGYLNAGIPDAPGNVGLLDQLEALRWIKQNVALFGGDANRITLFGWSAGSLSVGFHVMSPMSQGLFNGAIMQSFSVYTTMIDEKAEGSINKVNYLAKKAGCSDDVKTSPESVVDCLKKKDALELAQIDYANTSTTPSNFKYYFGPNTPKCGPDCNQILPEPLNKMLQYPIQVSTMLGTVKDEATEVFLNYAMPDKFPLHATPNITLEEAKGMLTKMVSKHPDAPVEKAFSLYFGKVDGNNESAVATALSNVLSDILIVCPSLYFAENVDASYLYWLNHRSQKDTNAPWVGVPHIQDMYFLFGEPFRKPDKYTDQDREFSQWMIEIWSSFAKSSYPVTYPSWTDFKSAQPMVYVLSPEREGMQPHPRKEACDLWRPIDQPNYQ